MAYFRKKATFSEQKNVPDWLYGLFGGLGLPTLAGAASKLYVNLVLRDLSSKANDFGNLVQEAKKRGIKLYKGQSIDDNFAIGGTKPAVVVSTRSPGVLAHEMGHIATPGYSKFRAKTQRAANLASALGPVAASLDPNEDRSLLIAGLSSAASIPTLASETAASVKGRDLLRQHTSAKGLRSFGSFKGLPTYFIHAALPLMAWKLKKDTGGFGQQNFLP